MFASLRYYKLNKQQSYNKHAEWTCIKTSCPVQVSGNAKRGWYLAHKFLEKTKSVQLHVVQTNRTTPGSWALALATHCFQPQCMNCIPHVQCDTSWTMPMITTITLARTFACTFFVAWTLACTFFVAWTLACTFLRLGLWLARFFCCLHFGSLFFCGLDFDFHFCWWLALWLALFLVAWTLACTFFVAWTLACTLACTWNYGLQLFDPL